MGITDATTLFIASSSSGSARSNSSILDKLFKITDSGYVQDVTYFDEEENEVTMGNPPTAVYNVNSSYVIIVFSYYTDEGYLVRKSDGAVFSLENVGLPSDTGQSYYFENAKKIQTDSDSNIYYQVSDFRSTGDESIIKIDIPNPNSLTKTTYTPDTDNISGFCVTSEGHIAYNYGYSNRIKKSNGGLYNLPDLNGKAFWIGLDGKIKYQPISDANKVVTVTIDSSTYAVSTAEISGALSYMQTPGAYLLQFSDRIIGVSSLTDYINEFENPSGTPRKVTFSEIDEIDIAAASSDYYYLSGNDSSTNPLLLKVDPDDDSVTTLLSAGDYDVYKMVVSSDNIVSFNALRMVDGVKVIGEIDASGNVTILNESINSEVVALERIN